MISKGKIGVILPDFIDSVSFELLSGIAEKANSLGYDVLLFSGIFNSQPDIEYYSYIEGMDNIYELVCKADLDGIIFGADFFNNADLKNRIYGLLEKQKAPCVVMGEEHEGYDSVFMKQRGSVKEITSHLINEHGCRSFYFLSGFAGNRDSEERLAGFRDALDEAGIAFDEKNVFYGNFWVKEPEKLAEKIACGEVEMPDAVVCANDVMAMSLVNALTARGISVPGDIAVTGFDGRWEAYMMSPRITTVIGSFYRFGSDAVRRLMSLIGREDTSSDRSYQRIRFGTSCGCSSFEYGSDYSDDAFLKCHISRQMDRAFKQKQYIATDYISQLSKASTMEELIERMDSLAHILPYWKTIDFCLCGDWFYDFSSPDSFRSQGFSDKTQLILSKRYNTNARCGYDFPTGWVVPELNNEHEPRIWVITSLHSYERILGYTAASYEKAEDVCLDDLYVNWMDAVSNGLILLRRRLYRE
ncbi:MAG: substrate-binding domain-containing protein, partial [Ruminococcus sp.]|nr:substrate-binding domain-containing protein [Ruminococcus sp.]